MSASTKPDLPKGLTVDEFLAWCLDHPGRFELHDGSVVAMAAERAEHALTKVAVFDELRRSIAAAGVACRTMPDGLTVRVSATRVFEPDALVYCGPRLDGEAVEVPNPVIVVEVSSPSTMAADSSLKLKGYFSIGSVHHYILIAPKDSPLILHSRQDDGSILTRLLGAGTLYLDPPGIEIDVARCFDIGD